jgi:MYXO-CTERM domain-containing protein
MFRALGPMTIAIALTATQARAEQCLPGPAKISGLRGGPEWTDFDEDEFWRPELHDPRWAGSAPQMLTFVPGSTGSLLESAASVRTLVLDDVLYVAAYLEDDPNGPTLADTFHFGYTEGTSNEAHVFKVELACNTLTPIGAPPVPPGSGFPAAPADPDAPRVLDGSVVKYWHSDDARTEAPTWVPEPSSSTPTWAARVKGACWDRATTSSPRWAVTLRIQLKNPGNQDRQMFFGVSTSSGGSPSTITVLGNVPPVSADAAVGSTLAPKSASDWERFTTDTSSSSSPCRNGLVVSKSDLGVWLGEAGSPSGGTLVDKVCAGGECGSGDNIVRITAKRASRLYSPWEVRARFRISDWGTSTDTREFGTWQDIWTRADGSRPNPLTVDDAVLSADSRWHFDATESSVTIDFECLRGSDPYCPRLQSGDNSGQAFLVEIARGTAGGQKVKTAWALRNMRYRDLSVADEQAAISVAGLEEVFKNKDAREVYLQVIARNLPAHDSKPKWLETKAMQFAKAISEQTFTFEQHIPKPVLDGSLKKPRTTKTDDYRAANEFAATQSKLAAVQAKSVGALAVDNTPLVRGVEKHEALAMTEDQLLDAVWPTYRIRPYYVKSRERGAEGEERTVLVPMPSFGLRFTHDRDLYGFNYTLKDEANKVMAPITGTSNWYKLTIPNEGRRNVRLGVVAEEEPKLSVEPPTILPPTAPPTVGTKGCGKCAVGASSSPWAALVGLALVGAGSLRRRGRRPLE